jgi:hypothetical protein
VRFVNDSSHDRQRPGKLHRDWTYDQKIVGHIGVNIQVNEHFLNAWVFRALPDWIMRATFKAIHVSPLALQVSWVYEGRTMRRPLRPKG